MTSISTYGYGKGVSNNYNENVNLFDTEYVGGG